LGVRSFLGWEWKDQLLEEHYDKRREELLPVRHQEDAESILEQGTRGPMDGKRKKYEDVQEGKK